MDHNVPCVLTSMPAIEESEGPPEPQAHIPGSHVLGKDEVLELDGNARDKSML